MDPQFKKLIRKWTLWFRLRRTAVWAVRGLIFGMALALGVGIMGILLTRLLLTEYVLLVVIAPITCAIVAGLIAGLWNVSSLQVARFFDLFYHLNERISTTFEVRDLTTSPFYPRLLADALNTSELVKPAALFHGTVVHLQAYMIIGLLVAISTAPMVARRTWELARTKRVTENTISAEVAKLDQIKQGVIKNEKLSEADKAALARQLDQAIQNLKQSQTLEQAIAVLAATQQQLSQMSDPQAQQQAQALTDAGQRLLNSDPENQDSLQALANDLVNGDYQAASQELQNLDPSNLTPEQSQALADQLESLAESVQDSNPQLAQQLNQAAQALHNGDPQAARQALGQAAETLSNTGQQITRSQAAQQASDQAGQGQQRLIQAGRSAQGQQAQGQGQGQSQGQGQGASSQPGQGSEGGGAGRGSSNGSESQGPEASAQPIQQNNGPGGNEERPYEQIYAPQRLGGAGGDQVEIPGNGNQGPVIGQGPSQPGTPGQSTVPYIEVYPVYAEIYRQAIDNGHVPLSMRNLVRDYFSSLQP